MTPVENELEPACALTGDLTLITGEERMLLQASCTRNLEQHPMTVKLDGVVLKAQRTRRSPGRPSRSRSRASNNQAFVQQAAAVLGEPAAEAA